MFKRERTSALIAGVSLLIMALSAGIAYGFLHKQLVVPGNATATALSIAANQTDFIVEIALWWLIFTTDIIVSIALYNFYKVADKGLAVASMCFRLAYSLILGVSIMFLATAGSVGSEALHRIQLFEKIWSVGLIIFSVHLFLLGLLGIKSKSTPLPLSWLIIAAGFCYMLLHSLFNLGNTASNLATIIEPFLSIPMALAELILAIWLIYGFVRTFPRSATGS